MINRINTELAPYFIPYQTKRNTWVLRNAPFQGNIYRYTSFTNLLSILEGRLSNTNKQESPFQGFRRPPIYTIPRILYDI